MKTFQIFKEFFKVHAMFLKVHKIQPKFLRNFDPSLPLSDLLMNKGGREFWAAHTKFFFLHTKFWTG